MLSFREMFAIFRNNILLKQLLVYLTLVLLASPAAMGQYYLRGEIVNEKKEPVQNVKILLHSSKLVYYSGTSGGFGIETRTLYDSLTLSLDGYESKTVGIKADLYQNLDIRLLPSNANRGRPKMISITKDLKQATRYRWYVGDESYFQLVENEYVNAARFPNTGFSLNVNKASYSNIRRFLNMHSTVPPDAIRTEELLNYFNLHYREPEKDQVFRLESQLTNCPWNDERQLLFLNVNAKKVATDLIPASNFVFLIDVSGSMDMPNRLPLLKAAFQMLVRNLRDKDTVSIVMYGGTVGVWLPPTSGGQKEKIIASIEELTASGDTPGESAIMTAYQLARKSFIKGGNNRVILATDGDFNVGNISEKALEEMITKERQSGVYLTCLGVGMGNYKDSKLETLAKKGNGNFAYLDDIHEAEKVLVKELTQTFYSVADDVFLNIQFNADLVKQYRLIGFDNKKDAIADSTGELEGGEIGSGSSVMAVFEIEPAHEVVPADNQHGNLANVSMRYRLCNDSSRKKINYTCPANYIDFKNIDPELQFATAVSMFGLKLRQSKHIRLADWNDIEIIATAAIDTNNYLQNQFVQLVDKAKKIYSSRKKKKKTEE
jgi:Ca-activated chloride channel homolog